MRKVLKWIGVILGGLLGLLLVAGLGLVIYANASFKTTDKNRPLYPITADTSPEGLARGEYLMEAVTSCATACHSEYGDQPFAGGVLDVNDGPVSATMGFSNITQDRETGIGGWTDAEIARAIREGYDKDGVRLMIMPSPQYHALSDADVAAIVGYLRQIAPVRNEVPPIQANLVAKVLNTFGAFGSTKPIEPITAPHVAPEPGTAAYGEYLSRIGDCRACHGPDLTGGIDPFIPPGPDITSAGRVALWSEAEFITTMRTGTLPNGRTMSEDMPWVSYGKMTDQDLRSLYLYLSSTTDGS
jgi:mono/diheme cytochrome c family protein